MNEIICCDVIDGLEKIDDESVDVIIADPPYNMGIDFGICKDKMTWDDYTVWCTEWLDHCERTLKDTGSLFIWGTFFGLSRIYLKSLPCPMNEQCKDIPWTYTNKNGNSKNNFQTSHELCLYCWKSNNKIFNHDAVKEYYTDAYKINAVGKQRVGTPGRFGSGKPTEYKDHGGASSRDFIDNSLVLCERKSNRKLKELFPIDSIDEEMFWKSMTFSDVIRCGTLAGGKGKSEGWFFCKTCDEVYPSKESSNHKEHEIVEHKTQKPYHVTEKLLLATKPKESGLMVAPFAGTGSECAVANDLNMDYMGFDVNKDYTKLANGFLKNRKKNYGSCTTACHQDGFLAVEQKFG